MPYKDPEKQREYTKKWYEENKEKVRESNKKWAEENKECSKCKETKPIDDFAKGINAYWCKKCKAQYARNWRKSNPEKMKEENRKRYKKRRRS